MLHGERFVHRFLARRLVALVLSLTFLGILTPDLAAAAQATISGALLDQSSNTPIVGASIVAQQGTQRVGGTTSDATGQFHLVVPGPGIYTLVVSAAGYVTAHSSDVVIPPGGSEVTANLALAHGTSSGSGPTSIGSVSTSTQRTALQTSVTVSRSIDPQTIAGENFMRVGNALQQIPGVNLRNQNTTVSDDMYIDLRGLKPSEAQTLLDGHPIGPIGVLPGTSGQFNFQDSPLFALRNVQVTFGAGALGLYGTDSTGGTIDMQTIDPTPQQHFDLQQGFGTQGHQLTNLKATGTEGKLGYALVYGVDGTSGGFPPQQLTHNGSFGTNFTSASIAANTYAVSQNYDLRNSLAKLRYAISPATTLTVTAYDATSWDDKSGTDNNETTYNGQLQGAPINNSYAKSAGCASGDVGVLTDSGIAIGGNQYVSCLTPQQWASATTGPQGSGPAWQAIGNQDYHARLQTTAGAHTITVDGFVDDYNLQYNRSASAYNAAGGFFSGPFNQNVWHSRGFLVSDDFVTGQHDIGYGFYTQHEQEYGNTYTGAAPYLLSPTQPQSLNNNNVFLRDVYSMNEKLSFYLNAWAKHISTVSKEVFDPRLSVVYHPRPNDVFRLTGGRSDGEPDPSLSAENYTAATAINAPCGSLSSGGKVGIGSAGNPNLSDESATDYEAAYGHRFHDDSMIQVDYYNTHETNMLFTTAVPIGAVPAGVLANDANYILNNLCPGTTLSAAQLEQQFTLSQAINAGAGLFRGVEISGRMRATPTVAFDYTYDIQQAAQYDVPTALLKSNPYIINGQQIAGIPMHTATLGVDYQRNGLHARIDGTFIGSNNGIEQPPYAWADGTVSKDVKHTTVSLGVFNLFNSHGNIFSQLADGVAYPANQYYPNYNAYTENQKLRFLTPRSLMLTVTQHI
jgi:hypothetical protein